ncbi:LuxR C-terminal-related transcriptional regulator [Natronoglycomyces albus]|uniref:Response regulator transcription factor n=1 Tax=Natronoglycomyces albus TaxID=2811108 RepID=A0A895XK58_9ACTN|nr:response regulator transcription factor [Natronoglycomyces albus]QSB04202.1 response regulator transcription factor [Natronoglycomyces albus]
MTPPSAFTAPLFNEEDTFIQPPATHSPTHTVSITGHPMFVAGLEWLVNASKQLRVVSSFTGRDLTSSLRKSRTADAAVVDFDYHSGVSGSLLRKLYAENTNLIVFSAGADWARVQEAIGWGAIGYIDKCASPEQILTAIHLVAGGSAVFSPHLATQVTSRLQQSTETASFPNLTPRENEVLALVATGMDNFQIAKQLGVSRKTVRNHLSHLLAKLGVASRSEAIARAHDAGMGTSDFG